ncbi:hypothetical protein FXO38_21272 [Capsicum annuum]|nr:hypothetical protein FXO38_21272 [Capsicum annuum]
MDGRSFKPSDSQKGKPPGVTFARRTSSGRYVNLSRDSLDSEISGIEFANYTVHMPPTPDNQPFDPTISQRVEEQYVSNSLFSGGYNSATRAHLMDKVIDSEANHPQMVGTKGSSCAVQGCDGKVMSDGRGEDILPCECDFKICRDCYIDAVKTGDGICPGCKETYKNTDLAENAVDPSRQPLSLTSNVGMSKSERRLSYPVEKLSCYVSDDGGALLTFEAMAETASFANIWVPFCRKHVIELRNPESYKSVEETTAT